MSTSLLRGYRKITGGRRAGGPAHRLAALPLRSPVRPPLFQVFQALGIPDRTG
ncbi:hypothetical protein AB0B07_00990 [Streptomyces sioyaensis]|uniref:hypothetical protein n=1 Tax=Streptomyces sioyaensis TaxID=67364 RepID=UPI0033CB2A24